MYRELEGKPYKMTGHDMRRAITRILKAHGVTTKFRLKSEKSNTYGCSNFVVFMDGMNDFHPKAKVVVNNIVDYFLKNKHHFGRTVGYDKHYRIIHIYKDIIIMWD